MWKIKSVDLNINSRAAYNEEKHELRRFEIISSAPDEKYLHQTRGIKDYKSIV